jgi:hypothetical protein
MGIESTGQVALEEFPLHRCIHLKIRNENKHTIKKKEVLAEWLK